jgi:hypothetical protein
MTRPFFKRDRISDFELLDRHSHEAIAAIKMRIREGHPIDFQVGSLLCSFLVTHSILHRT